MPEGFDVDTVTPEDISTTAADFGAEMVDFDDTTHDAARVYFEIDTDNDFPEPTQLDSSVDVGLFSQDNQVLKRGQDLMPDTDYFVRAQAENVVYSDDSLFSQEAKDSDGFILDVVEKDFDPAFAGDLVTDEMSGIDGFAEKAVRHPDVLTNLWSKDVATSNFWSQGDFVGDSTEGYWSLDVDFADRSELLVSLKGNLPVVGYSTSSNVIDIPSSANGDDLGFNGTEGWVAVATDDGDLYIYDVEDLTEIEQLSLSIDPDDLKIAVDESNSYLSVLNGLNGNQVVYDTSDFTEVTTLDDPTAASFIVYDEINNYLFVADEGTENIYVYDSSDGFNLENTINVSTPFGNWRGVDVDGSRNLLVLTDQNDGAKLYDTTDFSSIQTILPYDDEQIRSANFSTSKGELIVHTLAAFNDDRTVYVYDSDNSFDQVNAFEPTYTEWVDDVAVDDVNGFYSILDGDEATIYNLEDYSEDNVVSADFNISNMDIDGLGGLLGLVGDGSVELFSASREGPETEVVVGGDVVYNSEISGDSFNEETIDVSSYDSVQELRLRIAGDLGSDSFSNDLGAGATGDGNSFIIYSDESDVSISPIKTQFSDLAVQ